MEFAVEILRLAKSFIGNEELLNNSGFKDSKFQSMMEKIGWMTGWAWCASFVRLVYLKAAADYFGKDSEQYKIINKTLKHGVLRTYRAAKNSKNWAITEKPVEGGILIWKHSRTTGHEGIALNSHSVTVTVEGNTNERGEREGKFVLSKVRSVHFDNKYLGCLSFVNNIDG